MAGRSLKKRKQYIFWHLPSGRNKKGIIAGRVDKKYVFAMKGRSGVASG